MQISFPFPNQPDDIHYNHNTDKNYNTLSLKSGSDSLKIENGFLISEQTTFYYIMHVAVSLFIAYRCGIRSL